jgi:hypothetical protein
MDNSRKIVVISILTILIASIVVSILGWNLRTFDSRFSDQKCSREGKFCIYNDIPAGMMFTNPEQSLKDVQPFKGNLSDYIIPNSPIQNDYPLIDEISEPKRIAPQQDFYLWSIDNYRCTSVGEKFQIIEYFAKFCGSSIKYDCETERRALVCGNNYLIQETLNYESKLYGPYDMP